VNTRATGVALAFCTAVISGVSIYVNGYAVKHFTDATVYTTAKNAVAGALLVVLVLALRSRTPDTSTLRTRNWRALLAVAVVGGSVPFILFFEGLKQSQATQASFIQKTLVVWVAILAVPFLHERLRAPHLAAIALLVLGQAWLVGSAGTVTFGRGEAMILTATLLWAVEVVLVKRFLATIATGTLAVARMGLGAAILLGWVVVSGKLGALTSLDGAQLKWVLVTGVLLTLYVATWYAALARAQAVDVTAMLVFGAVVTAGLAGTLDGAHVNGLGIGLVAAGSGLAAYLAVRTPRRVAVT
jgi:drug/metabolite transporter (DMT)-like permease